MLYVKLSRITTDLINNKTHIFILIDKDLYYNLKINNIPCREMKSMFSSYYTDSYFFYCS